LTDTSLIFASSTHPLNLGKSEIKRIDGDGIVDGSGKTWHFKIEDRSPEDTHQVLVSWLGKLPDSSSSASHSNKVTSQPESSRSASDTAKEMAQGADTANQSPPISNTPTVNDLPDSPAKPVASTTDRPQALEPAVSIDSQRAQTAAGVTNENGATAISRAAKPIEHETPSQLPQSDLVENLLKIGIGAYVIWGTFWGVLLLRQPMLAWYRNRIVVRFGQSSSQILGDSIRDRIGFESMILILGAIIGCLGGAFYMQFFRRRT